MISIKAEQRLNEEKKRVGMYLHDSTLERLMKTCENVLIEKQLSTLHDEFPTLLRNEQLDDLGRMFDLISKINDAYGNMRETLQAHIGNEGAAAILQNKDQCNSVSNP